MTQRTIAPSFEWNPVDIEDFYSKAEASAGTALPIPELAIVHCGADAINKVTHVITQLELSTNAPVLIVQDATPMRRAGDDLKAIVRAAIEASGRRTEVSILVPDTGLTKLITSFSVIKRVKEAIEPGQTVIALGSGCITDIVKHACFELGETNGGNIPLIAVQTANSVCAFTSRMSVLTINGVKRTVPSRMADALIMDTQVLQDAPPLYRTGGLGDVAVAAVSFADLRLAEQLGMGRWNQLAYETSSDIRDILLAGDASIGDDGPVGQEVAGKLLTVAGLALTLCGDTAPLSGYEHVTSHMLDMAAKANGRSVANHGHQCALAAVLSLLLYKHVIARFDKKVVQIGACYPDIEKVHERIDDVFSQIDPSGAAAKECARDYDQKLAKWSDNRATFKTFLGNWLAMKEELEKYLMEPAQFVDLLRKIGHPLRFEDMEIPLSRTEVRWAFQNAHLMRKRFTIGDLADLSGQFGDDVCDLIFAEFDVLTNRE